MIRPKRSSGLHSEQADSAKSFFGYTYSRSGEVSFLGVPTPPRTSIPPARPPSTPSDAACTTPTPLTHSGDRDLSVQPVGNRLTFAHHDGHHPADAEHHSDSERHPVRTADAYEHLYLAASVPLAVLLSRAVAAQALSSTGTSRNTVVPGTLFLAASSSSIAMNRVSGRAVENFSTR